MLKNKWIKEIQYHYDDSGENIASDITYLGEESSFLGMDNVPRPQVIPSENPPSNFGV